MLKNEIAKGIIKINKIDSWLIKNTWAGKELGRKEWKRMKDKIKKLEEAYNKSTQGEWKLLKYYSEGKSYAIESLLQ